MELLDCDWCGSAGSIERGFCQVCLMRFPDPEPQAGVEVVVALPEPAERHAERTPRLPEVPAVGA